MQRDAFPRNRVSKRWIDVGGRGNLAWVGKSDTCLPVMGEVLAAQFLEFAPEWACCTDGSEVESTTVAVFIAREELVSKGVLLCPCHLFHVDVQQPVSTQAGKRSLVAEPYERSVLAVVPSIWICSKVCEPLTLTQ